MPDIAPSLIKRHPRISDQVSQEQIETILHQLQEVVLSATRGDIVEFGCYIGTTSVFIRRLLDQLNQSDNRAFHVYDSFAGLPPKSAQDASPTGEHFTAGALAVSKKMLLREFQKANLRPPIVHKGWFSQLNNEDIPDQIAFAFLDGDFYQSIRDSLRLVLPKMRQGGTIVIDDYAREALPGVAAATREFFPGDRVTIVHNLGVIHL